MYKIINSLTNKKDYCSPEIEVFQYLTEKGYALSEFETYDGGDSEALSSYSNEDPDNPDFYMGGLLGEENL